MVKPGNQELKHHFYKMNTWEEQALMTLSEEDRMLATKYEAAGAWVSYFLLPLS